MRDISMIILAGGRSSRMGRDKAAMLWNGDTFLNTVLAAGSGFSERLVSLSASSDPAPISIYRRIIVLEIRPAGCRRPPDRP